MRKDWVNYRLRVVFFPTVSSQMLWLIGYGPDVFEFSDSFLIVKLPYNPLVVNESAELVGGVNGGVNVGENVGENSAFSECEEILIKAIRENKNITLKEMASLIKKSGKTVERLIKKSSRIKRVGGDKGGHWEIIDIDD